MDTYRIVNATKLDSELKEFADILKEKRGEDTAKQYSFPVDFKNALETMYYDDAPNTVEDLQVDGPTVHVGAGFYAKEESATVATYEGENISNISPVIGEDKVLLTSNKFVNTNITIQAVPISVMEDVAVDVDGMELDTEGKYFDKNIKLKAVPQYEGNLEFAPTTSEQIIEVENKFVKDNIIIAAMPTGSITPLEMDATGMTIKTGGKYFENDITIKPMVKANVANITWERDEEGIVTVIIPNGYYMGASITIPAPEVVEEEITEA